ncbi:NAD(P)-dependent oxidoreductase [Hugenholtzia roseola]|uniref:NAD(P)-dependent oxidoreductase n=1 Tax=Hugenholtzia roseola TaxID=1002 RepID=UPI00040882D9|nr:NAD(P)-dependent oxidoreductase [Hugenholtzia roseola]
MSIIALIKEDKIPIDKRVALTPTQCQEVRKLFPSVEIWVEKSPIRCFSDAEYAQAGCRLVEKADLEQADILLGVKEVPIPNLVAEKTYFFFSHTIKMQPYNRNLLREILAKNIRLIDYEVLTDAKGERVIAFGRYAGLVGAYNGLLSYGKKMQLFDLKPAHQCFDMQELKLELEKVKLPAVKIVVTGGGRVSKGAIEMLQMAGIRQVSPQAYLSQHFEEAVFTQLRSQDYHLHKENQPFEAKEFYQHPENFKGDFLKYAHCTDLLIAAAYWNPKAPLLFTKEEMRHSDFKIKVIADVTCDIEGSIPSTHRPSTIAQPNYDYNPTTEKEETAFSRPENITVMAVDNLPCELPRDASRDFGREMIAQVLPHLLGADAEKRVENATIADKGSLLPKFAYLQAYVEGK